MIYTFYFRVLHSYGGYEKGVHKITSRYQDVFLWADVGIIGNRLDLIRISDKIWIQDSTGKVKIIKDRKSDSRIYINQDEEQMKEFMWIKLQS